MVVTLGILLIGGHFLVSVAVATHLSESQSGWAFILFMVFAALSGLVVTKIQTWLEMFMIRRHVKGCPNSGWKVIGAKRKPKKSTLPALKLPNPAALLKSVSVPAYITNTLSSLKNLRLSRS